MARFVSNPVFKAEMQLAPEFQDGLSGIASEAAREVKRAAQPFRNTGYFIASISSPGPYVATSDDFWHLIEFGGANNPAFSPIRRGFMTAGLRLDLRQL